jgi:hypothetical protein
MVEAVVDLIETFECVVVDGDAGQVGRLGVGVDLGVDELADVQVRLLVALFQLLPPSFVVGLLIGLRGTGLGVV